MCRKRIRILPQFPAWETERLTTSVRRLKNCQGLNTTSGSQPFTFTEHALTPSLKKKGESVTYVSGTMCYLCLRPLRCNAVLCVRPPQYDYWPLLSRPYGKPDQANLRAQQQSNTLHQEPRSVGAIPLRTISHSQRGLQTRTRNQKHEESDLHRITG